MLKVWFHRSRAAAWALVGVLSFAYGWANSVALVWAASLYANIVSDWTAGEAADDRHIIDGMEALMGKTKKQRAAKVAAMRRKGLGPVVSRRIAGVKRKRK